MKKRKVVARKNLPTRFPLIETIVLYLLFDKINALEWAWGVLVAVLIIGWIASIIVVYQQESIEIFKESIKKSYGSGSVSSSGLGSGSGSG